MALSARHDPQVRSFALPTVNSGPVAMLAGLALTVYALFQTFYLLKLPVVAIRRMAEATADPAIQDIAARAANQAARINAAGGVPANAWEAFGAIDLAVAGLTAAAVALVVLQSLGHVGAAVGRYAWLLATGAVALVAFRMLVPPVPAEAHDYVRLGSGAWMVLAGTCLVWLGAVVHAVRR